MKYDIMLDLEAFDTAPDAAIVAIGAVSFDMQAGRIESEFYQRVSLSSSCRVGGTISPDTVMWWLRQSQESRDELSGESASIQYALALFSAWIGENNDGVRVWGNGAAFDNVILRRTYERCEMQPPWQWWNDRCYRTARDIMPPVDIPPFSGVRHNALDDARSQALHLIAMCKAQE